MNFADLIYEFIEQERSKNTWEVILPSSCIIDEFYLCAKEHIKNINPYGMITITIKGDNNGHN
jgi:hypothetical protein